MSGSSCVLRVTTIIALVRAGAGAIADVPSPPQSASGKGAIVHAAHPPDPTGAAVHVTAAVGDCPHGDCTAAARGAEVDCRATAPSCGANARGPVRQPPVAPAASVAAFRALSGPLLAGLDPSADPVPLRG